jgi:hypothetical protein
VLPMLVGNPEGTSFSSSIRFAGYSSVAVDCAAREFAACISDWLLNENYANFPRLSQKRLFLGRVVAFRFRESVEDGPTDRRVV